MPSHTSAHTGVLGRSGAVTLPGSLHVRSASNCKTYPVMLSARMLKKSVQAEAVTQAEQVVQEAPVQQAETGLSHERMQEPVRGKAVVVGAGPAGALAAVNLARNGFSVEVYEQRAKADPIHRIFDRSYSLAMSHRGMGAVEKVGIDMSRFRAFPYRGSIMWKAGSFQEVFHEPVEAKVLVERMELVRHIIDEADRVAGHAISWHWEHTCHDVNVASQDITFRQATGQLCTTHYDMLVGADGVSSHVRKALEQQAPDFQGRWHGRMHRVDKFFHQVTPAADDPPMTPPRAELDRDATVLRFYNIDSPPPLSIGLFYIQNNQNGTFSGGVGFSRADHTEEGSGGTLRTPEDYEAFLNQLTMYPKGMRRSIAEDMAARPWYSSGSTLQVPRLQQGRVVLIGDAAHAVSAAFGQGVNAALEDCTVLGEVCSQAVPGEGVEQTLSRYNRTRYPDVSALTEMDRKAEAMVGAKGKWNLPYAIYQTHLMVNGWLHKRFPERFQHPGLVPMMTIQTAPYSRILTRIRTPFYSMLAAAVVVLALVLGRAMS